MRLFHVTNATNVASIRQTGLDPALSVGRRKATWSGTATKVAWGIVHVLSKPRNRGLSITDIVVLELDVPRWALRRHSKSVWYSYVPLDPCLIVAVRAAASYGPAVE